MAELGYAHAGSLEALMTGYGLLEQLYKEVAIGQQELELATGGRPICKENCGLCCQRNVPVAMEIETKYIMSNMHQLPRKQLAERALGWMSEQHSNLKLFNKIKGRAYQDDERQQLFDDQQTLQVTACPFLSEDKRCMLHNYRPLVCRAYGVTLAADEWCPRPLAPSETAETRMIVAYGRPRGNRISQSLNILMSKMRQMAPELAACSWLPGLLARELNRDEVIKQQREGRVADIKLALGSQQPKLFRDTETDTIPIML